jgi:hypothetical protein
MSFSAALLFSAILLVPASIPDEVKTKDGKEYKNLTLVAETATHYTFTDLDGKKIMIAKDQIEKYEKKPTIRDELKTRLKATKPDDAKALLDIAGWAKTQGLPKDSREVLELVIKADPDNAEARAALDYVKYEGAWVLKKDVAARFEAAKGEQLKGLGYKLEGGKWMSPAEISRAKAKLVQVGPYWVTAEQQKTIQDKELEYREGDWLSKEDLAKFDQGQRKVKGVWKPILDADEAHREVKDPWVLRGVYVEVRSTVRYSKTVLAFKAADDSVRGAVALSGVEPDVWGKYGPLLLILEKDDAGYRMQGERAQGDWAALRSSSDGMFYSPELAKGAGAAVTYFFDEDYVRYWAGRGGFEAFVGRVTDITRLDPVLLDAFASYFGSYVDEKYHPSSSSRFLFVGKPMRPVAKMFEGFKRGVTDDAQTHIRQLGFLIHFLAKKSPEGTQRALQRFLSANMTHRDLIEAILGKVDPAELEKEFQEFWTKFRDNFRP